MGRPFFAVTLLALTAFSNAGDSSADLAQELTNPVADLITVPIQMNVDRNLGPGDDGSKITTNVQPVIPFDINEDWNLITRTIVPVIHQDDVFAGEGSQFGLGDINLSLFLSPKQPTSGGLAWGAGPVVLLPTATDSLLGGKKWGAGPAAGQFRAGKVGARMARMGSDPSIRSRACRNAGVSHIGRW